MAVKMAEAAAGEAGGAMAPPMPPPQPPPRATGAWAWFSALLRRLGLLRPFLAALALASLRGRRRPAATADRPQIAAVALDGPATATAGSAVLVRHGHVRLTGKGGSVRLRCTVRSSPFQCAVVRPSCRPSAPLSHFRRCSRDGERAPAD